MLVISDVRAEPPVYGDLFAGKKFWIAQRTPARNDYIARVRYNGGDVVPLEKHADFLIVDHLRADLPAGGTSYRFIDKSIERAELQDPDDFRCGPRPGAVRDAGSARPARHTRTAFTADDDAELTAWVRSCEAQGSSINGNEIYKALQRRNERHSWQSWRDRWVKTLSRVVVTRAPRPVTVNVNPPPSPPSDAQPARPPRQLPRKPAEEPENEANKRRTTQSPAYAPSEVASVRHAPDTNPFTLEHFDQIFSSADVIMDIPYGRLADAWRTWSEANPAHSGEDWARYFDTLGKPIYTDLLKNPARAAAYDKAWDEWYPRNRYTATVADWIEHYRNSILPSFPPALSESPEIKAEPPGEEQPSDAALGPSNKVVEHNKEHKERKAEEEEESDEAQDEEQASLAEPRIGNAGILEGPLASASPVPEGPSFVALGKRPRDDTYANLGTPSPKKRLTNAEGPFRSVQGSIETTPSNGSRSLPHSAAPVAEQYGLRPGFAVYEENQADAASQLSELPIRNALADLQDGDMFDLLDIFRAQPTAPQEQNHMDLLDILTMHTLHYLSQPQSESQAAMVLGDKLGSLGVFAKLFGGEDEGEDDSEQQEEEQDQGYEDEADVDQDNIWLEVAQGFAKADDDVAEGDVASDAAEGGQEPSTAPASPNGYAGQLRPGNRLTVQQASDSTPSPQKHHTRPTSSSGGTVMTSFDMTTEVSFDLTSPDKAEAYISSRLAPPYNFPEVHILIAMHATCCNSSTLADAVLRWMRTNTTSKSKKGRRSSLLHAMLPDEPSVWTEEDDNALKIGLPSEKKRLERKHGGLGCKRRLEFLISIDS